MRIVRTSLPKVFIFENVKGLFSSNEGRDFEIILRTVADIGLYDCEWQLLNTRWFLPQNRERIYFIGHLRGASESKVFPIGENNKIFNEPQQETQGKRTWICSPSINAGYGKVRGGGELFVRDNRLNFLGGVMGDKNKMWLENGKDKSRNFPQGQRVYSPEGDACQITSQGGGMGAKTGLYMVQKSRGFNKGGEKELPTLTDHNYHQNNFLNGIRRLTPIECERLQGFPDNWTEGISDTQRYKCLGNAVSVPVVKAIGQRLLNQ